MSDAARTLRKGGTFTVVGQKNNYELRALKRMSDEDLAKLGFKRISPSKQNELMDVEEQHLFGQSSLTS